MQDRGKAEEGIVMSNIKLSALELVGNTPLLKISRYCEAVEAADANVLAKLEYLNPAGSIKDRVGKAMVEEADSFTRFQLYHGGALHNYSTVFPYFNPKASDTYSLSGSIASSAESIGISSDRKYTGSFTLHYVMLTDDAIAAERKAVNPAYKYYNASWLGMAEAYRDHLTETGKLSTALTEEDVEADLPLYIEVFGALETQETIATIPVWVMTPLTTFENVMTMYNELSDPSRNVKNINFKMTGFANGGMYSTMPYNLKWEKNLGGSKGFEELIAKADEIIGTNGIYRDKNFLLSTVAKLYFESGQEKWGDKYDLVLGGGFMTLRSPGYLHTGNIKYSDLQSILPFDNELVLCSVKGKDMLNKFINTSNSNYFIYCGEYGNSIKNSVDVNATYYIVTDTYSSSYSYNKLTVIEKYDADTFARDLLAEYIKAGNLAG